MSLNSITSKAESPVTALWRRSLSLVFKQHLAHLFVDSAKEGTTLKISQVLTKVAVYSQSLMPLLIYNRETWTLYQHEVIQLCTMLQHYIRLILNIKCDDFIYNADVLQRPHVKHRIAASEKMSTLAGACLSDGRWQIGKTSLVFVLPWLSPNKLTQALFQGHLQKSSEVWSCPW